MEEFTTAESEEKEKTAINRQADISHKEGQDS
jgi:hypothetical protein